MLKKLIISITVITLVLGTVLPIQAYGNDDISYEGRICRDLGILKGNTGVVDREYLETRPSRLQAAIMFLRLKGLEQDALAYSGRNNFKDSDSVAWKEGRNVLSYLKNHPELGWIGDGVNFLPFNPIDSRAYYKVLLESLGYKQKIDGDGDFDWNEVLEFAEEKGLKKVADIRNFTVDSLAIATVEALNTKMKGSGKKLIEYLVEIGDVDRRAAAALDLYSEGIDGTVKSVRAISNSKVEVVFEEPVGSNGEDADLYTIKQLGIKAANMKNESAVIIDTSAMNESTTYTLVFNDKSFSFKGLKKDIYAPKLITAECKDTDLVELAFDRVLDNITAQDTDTYAIEGVSVKSAELDSTNTRVRIVTGGIQTGRSYEIKIHNIKNADGVSTKLITKRFTGKKDTNPPKLNKLTVLNNIKLLLEFSDTSGLDKASAQDVGNYSITSSDGDLNIESAKVKDNDGDGLLETVELVTESQSSGRLYTLRIEDIADDSVLGNSITREIKKDFRGKYRDTSAPTVDRNPKAITGNIIEVVFKDANALDVESACDPDNYEIDEGLEIREIRIKNPSDLYSVGGKTVYLITDGMDKTEYYTLIIKNIMDEFGNELDYSTSNGYKKYRFRGLAEDNTPPYVTFVECLDSKTVEISFDNLLDEESAENIANYRIDGLALVTKAQLQADEKTVKLTVSSLSSDKNHTILLSNIRDISGNALYNISVSVVYNGNVNDTDAPEVEYIQAMNEEEIWVHFDEAVNAQSAELKASGLTFNQAGSVLDDGTAIVMKASGKMEDREYEVTSLSKVWDLRGNAYRFEYNLDFYGSDMENSPPEVSDWQQLDVKRFRVVFTEPVKLIGNGVSGIKNPGGVSLGWTADLNPQEEDTNEAYSTVDYIASKEIPAGREYSFNFTAMISDYIGKAAYDEDDDGGHSGSTILESYMEDDEDPYIEYVEAITRTKVQVVFSEAIDESYPGTYRISYEDEDNRLRYIDITRVEVDSKDGNRVNILTEDEMSQEYVYTLMPMSSAVDLAGNRFDTRDAEIDFEGSNIMSKDYIQGVEFLNAYSFKVIKSSKIYNKATALYELDDNGAVIGNNLMDGTSVRISDNVHKVTSKKPLLRDVKYKITVDGLEYRFYGVIQNEGIELDEQSREITFYGMDTDEQNVEAFRPDGDELDIDEVHGKFFIDAKESLKNGEWIYIYVKRQSDDAIIYGTRIKLEGMPAASSSKDIISFSFNKDFEPDIVGSINESTGEIDLKVPFGTDITKLVAEFTCSDYTEVKVDTVKQESGVTVQNFSDKKKYTVHAQDGTSKDYWVLVTVEESKLEKEIKSFVLKEPDPDITGVIDQANHSITLELPAGMDIKALVKPTIEASPETTVSPASLDEVKLSEAPVYTVTAKDGSKQEYTVNASVKLSQEKLIKEFYFPGKSTGGNTVIDNDNSTIDVTVPYGTEVTSLMAAFVCSAGAEVRVEGILQESEVTANNFSNTVFYNVIAQDKSSRAYEVKVQQAKNTEKKMLEFGFDAYKAAGSIDEGTKDIYVKLPDGTVPEGLVADFRCSEKATVKVGEDEQKSGKTANNFAAPLTYTVIAEDGSSQNYTVTVTVAAADEKKLTEFSFKAGDKIIKGAINEAEHKIRVSVPRGTGRRSLAAYFSYIGKSIAVGDTPQVSGVTVNDFRSPVDYIITASDGSQVKYTVIVTVSER